MRIADRLLRTLVFVLVLPQMIRAAQAVITIKGTVIAGMDYSGVFIPKGNAPFVDLKGQSFTLSLIVDGTKGTETVQCCVAGVPYGSSITGTGSASPVTAVLQIGNGSYPFGMLPSNYIQSSASRAASLSSNLSNARFGIVEDYNTAGTDGQADIQVSISPASGTPPLTTDYEWWAPFSRSSQLSNVPIAFDITRRTGTPPALAQRALGWLLPESIDVNGWIDQCPLLALAAVPSSNDNECTIDCQGWFIDLTIAYLQIKAMNALGADTSLLETQYEQSAVLFCQSCPTYCARLHRFSK